MAVIIAGTIGAGRHAWMIRPGHFAERHGLITIIALGELIVALGLPVVETLGDDGDLSGETLVALVAAGAYAALIWWSIFDRPLRALEHRHDLHDDPTERGRYARDVYTYAWLAIVAGIVLAAAGLEEIVLHPSEVPDTAFRWMFLGGTVLTMIGVGIAILRAFTKITFERTAGAAGLVALAALATSLEGLALVIAADLVIVVMLAVEHVRVEARYRNEVDPAAT